MNLEQIKNRKKALIGLILLALIGIPLTVFLALKQQEIRSRASGEAVQIGISPQTLTKNSGEAFSVNVNINAGTNSLHGIDTSVAIDKNIVDFVSFIPSAEFDTQIINNYSPSTGILRVTMVNAEKAPSTGNIKIGTLNLKAKAVGSATVNIQTNAQVVSSDQDTPLSINVGSNGTYTIVNIPTPTISPTPTPTPTRVPSPTPTRIPSPTPTIKPPTPTPTSGPAASPTPTQVPSSAPSAVPTEPPGNQTKLAFSIGLSGVKVSNNKNPIKESASFKIEIQGPDSAKIQTLNKTLTFDPASGKFKGEVNISIPKTNFYNIYISTPVYLQKRIDKTLTLNSANQLPDITLSTGDINIDNNRNLLDYNIIRACSDLKSRDVKTCPEGEAHMTNSDLDSNGVVDFDDINLWLREFRSQTGGN